jgi:hypothetical protein
MNLSAKMCGRGRPAETDVLGKQKRGCQKTERDLNEKS